MTNFDQTIKNAYTKLGYTPRNGQERIIASILDVFITQGKKNVILSADTGIGKSIIGAVVSECMTEILQPKLSSMIMVHQNSLAKQYAASFHHMDDLQYFQVKGASNYPCKFMIEAQGKFDATGEDCAKKNMLETEVKKYCSGCEYNHSKVMVQKTQNLITNYSLAFISKLHSEHIPPRLLQVFDEAHVLNEVFTDHTSIVVVVDKLNHYIKELTNHGNNKFDTQIDELTSIVGDLKLKKIDQSNYIQKISELGKVYTSISMQFSTMQTLVPSIKDKVFFGKLSKKYAGLSGNINNFIEERFEHVFDDTKDGEVSIRAIFIKDMMDLVLGEYNLFMSATLSRNFALETFNLEPDQTEYIDAPQVFPSENRPLLFIGREKLNYTNMKDQAIIDQIKKQVNVITNHHKDKGEKGLILVPSFALANTLSSAVTGPKVFLHSSGMKIGNLMEQFKEYSGSAVLISPSIYEGLDFKGDDSRFQIIVKTPYPSLGDKRIEYIAKNFGSIYRELALLKIIQGIGRSIRSEDDTATTYFLDASSKQLYDSSINVWKKRFVVKT